MPLIHTNTFNNLQLLSFSLLSLTKLQWPEQTTKEDAEPAAAVEAAEDPPAVPAPPPKDEEAIKPAAHVNVSEATVDHPVDAADPGQLVVVPAEGGVEAVVGVAVAEAVDVASPRGRKRSPQQLKSWMLQWTIIG